MLLENTTVIVPIVLFVGRKWRDYADCARPNSYLDESNLYSPRNEAVLLGRWQRTFPIDVY